MFLYVKDKLILDAGNQNPKPRITRGEEGDLKWIDNKITNETLMVSDFEVLSKKFAVIFGHERQSV